MIEYRAFQHISTRFDEDVGRCKTLESLGDHNSSTIVFFCLFVCLFVCFLQLLLLLLLFFCSGNGWHERQPDGGMLELCVRIVMRNFHSSDHWHDVPCVSSNDVAQYICMKPSTSKLIRVTLYNYITSTNTQCSSFSANNYMYFFHQLKT